MAKKPEHLNKSRWHSMPPEQKAKRLAKMREWQAANKDRILAQRRAKYVAKGKPPGYGNFERAKKYDYVRDAKIAIGECNDCGFPCDEVTHVCFAWDHIDPATKSFPLSKADKHTWDEIKAELEKCELVCHNCHAIRTYLEGHNRTERRQLTDETQLRLFD